MQLDNQPCINFGRSGIKLSLNFRMTGTANEPPRTGCVSDSEFPTNEADGIHSKRDELLIEGLGVVQRMKRHGIALIGTTADPLEKSVVKKLVSPQNCFSGVFMGGVTNTLVEEVVSAKNGGASNFRPCGGVCVTNSNNNRIRRSELSGTAQSLQGRPLVSPSRMTSASDSSVPAAATSSRRTGWAATSTCSRCSRWVPERRQEISFRGT